MKTNVANALNKINSFATKQNEEEERKLQLKQNYFERMKQKILSYCDRIAELETIVNSLGRNKIQNGKFFTNGIDHVIGFYCDHKHIVVQRHMFYWDSSNSLISNGYFGIEGGGCSGGDLLIDFKNKTLTYTFKGRELELNCISKMESIVERFELYEKSIYDYVENL